MNTSLYNVSLVNAIKRYTALNVKPRNMYSKELLKGTIEIIILKLLSENKRLYGYEITQRVKELTQDKIEISEGALYPALHKLEATGVVTTETVTLGKRVRKYYRLTRQGKSVATRKVKELNEFIRSIGQIMELKIILA
jgi:PadR family transcriptional regulator, regulatory protein PadR